MYTIFNVLALSIIAIYLIVILALLKSGRLYLKYALLWLFTGIIMALLILCPGLIQWFFDLCGIQVYSNGIFAVLVLFILLILLALTSVVSKLNERNRKLVQEIALLEKRVRELEKE